MDRSAKARINISQESHDREQRREKESHVGENGSDTYLSATFFFELLLTELPLSKGRGSKIFEASARGELYINDDNSGSGAVL